MEVSERRDELREMKEAQVSRRGNSEEPEK
jgi:hypothetical protein